MNSNIKTPLFLAVSILIVVSLAACSGKKETNLKNLPQEVKPVAEAIIDDSPAKFAATMSYPIERPYPLPPVNDSSEMVSYYSTLVDEQFKRKIELSPDSLWQLDGWRGWTLDDGSFLWIDDGKVYAIDYVSQRENVMLDSLRMKELDSLDPSMRSGWTPVLCVVDSVDGDIFRIDYDTTRQPPLYRLAGYAAGSDLSAPPTIMLFGSLDEEGTAGSRFYHFADSTGTMADYMPDILDPDSIPVIEIVEKGKTHRYPVKPSRWLNHIHPRHNNAGDSVSHDSGKSRNNLSMTKIDTTL